MGLTLLCAVFVVWYALRAAARRWTPARRVVERLAPYTGALHGWVLSAPATFTYVAIFTASTLVQKSAPPRLVNVLTRLDSTNLVKLRNSPVDALATSALWVADHGSGLIAYALVFGTVVAWAERRYGTPRTILICVSGHVFGSLLTAAVELRAIQTGRAPHRLAITTDVGVSYMMVAGCVAAVLLMRHWWLAAGSLTMAIVVIWPVIANHTIWDLGHLLATLTGLAVAALTLLFAPPRTPPDLRPCLPTPNPQQPPRPRPNHPTAPTT